MILTLLLFTLAQGERWAIELAPGSDPRAFAAAHHVSYVTSTPLDGVHVFDGAALDTGGRLRGGWAEQQVPRRHYTRTRDPSWSRSWHLHAWEGDIGLDAESVWNETTGRGVVVAIVDDGLQWNHPDLSGPYVRAHSWNFNSGGGADPSPARGDGHGTSCAGVCCATRDNNVCGAGVCPDCRVGGLRTIAEAVDDATEANALAFHPHDVGVYSCSWGPYDDGNRLEGPGQLAQRTLEQQTRLGRQGKGSLYVWAAGNGAEQLDNCNYDGYANSRYTIAVGALSNAGTRAPYSECCSALFVVAPSSGGTRGISTVDLLGSDG
jgi:subtilisin family serine protease